jgi:hypothetical protein
MKEENAPASTVLILSHSVTLESLSTAFSGFWALRKRIGNKGIKTKISFY